MNAPRFVRAEGSRADAPVAVVLGWYRSSERALGKFAKLYVDRGISTCTFILGNVFASPEKINAEAGRLLDGIRRWRSEEALDGARRDGSEPPRLIIHAMSNNGCLLYVQMLRCARRDERHRWLLGSVVGTVYDCGPGELSLRLGVKAVLASRPPAPVRLGVVSAPALLAALLLLALRRRPLLVGACLASLALWMRRVASRTNFSYRAALANDPSACPQLYLYSAKDALCCKSVIEELIERRRQHGVVVTARRWESGAHMELLREHRQDYEAALDEFLLSLK